VNGTTGLVGSNLENGDLAIIIDATAAPGYSFFLLDSNPIGCNAFLFNLIDQNHVAGLQQLFDSTGTECTTSPIGLTDSFVGVRVGS
jgi:hypothetical protein